MDNNERLPTHLFSSTDTIPFGDLRDRVPHPWQEQDTLLGTRRLGHLRGIEILPQRGLIVVDGNHLFLNSLRIAHENTATWKRLASDGDNRYVARGAACPFDPISARLVSYIAAQIIHRTLDVATQRAALSIVPDGMRIISSDHLFSMDAVGITDQVDRKTTVVLDNDWRIVAFDAPLPDLNQLISDLHRWRSYARKNDPLISSFLDLLDRGLFEYRLSAKKTYREDYELKNNYIHDLGRSYFADSVFGSKKVRWTPGIRPYLVEKQVDVLLTMELCDAALDGTLDWVCVITNDSDYIPALSRVRDSGKKVIWLSADEPKRQSKELLNLFSADGISVGELFTSFPLFESLFALPASSATSGTLPSGEEYSTAPWNKSLNEHREEAEEELWAEGCKDDERGKDN